MREGLFNIRIITEKCLDLGIDLYVCFIDYGKAFDRVDHVKLIENPNDTAMCAKEIKLIRKIY